jgi:hypothetical protein
MFTLNLRIKNLINGVTLFLTLLLVLTLQIQAKAQDAPAPTQPNGISNGIPLPGVTTLIQNSSQASINQTSVVSRNEQGTLELTLNDISSSASSQSSQPANSQSAVTDPQSSAVRTGGWSVLILLIIPISMVIIYQYRYMRNKKSALKTEEEKIKTK